MPPKKSLTPMEKLKQAQMVRKSYGTVNATVQTITSKITKTVKRVLTEMFGGAEDIVEFINSIKERIEVIESTLSDIIEEPE